ncbi:phage late control D family protein [Pseudomonas fluorescens]|uniref:contractile injection system protein, VgrG/Pvc8 family n=1 Tax=Pseudomonas fluorescens group TaxID=136843 RepID=UPI0015E6486C|nr:MULTISPECIES: contractile injection system protein, VgrG/Pvc8 family [Pseudomonas fluorescens group]MBA1429575.1 phage late control D family protein [Pseudomonas orientalis]MBD8146988.1 phage late control D family protein [Pseudomonas fluorescens]MBD8175432.1 phage late control D family protein [Pseudomonas fluorescens]MBD8743888.1 phage late control D family protein [Pseudomonas fluorescens]MBD8750163.1 phage late control D family protein [Pseudomonas fluorescens]
MALGFTPAVELYGANAALFNERLLAWEHIDAAGFVSDQLKLTLDIEGLEGLPELGGKIGLRVGYLESGLVDMGVFKITQRKPSLFPMRLVLVATAAPFDEHEFKQRRTASHGPTTLGALFRQLTSRYGFSPRVAPELDGERIAHIDQTNESDMAFLTRLAKRFDAVAKPVDELYVLGRKGQIKSLSGKALPDVRLSVTRDNHPGDHAFISATLTETSRAKYKGVQTSWWDAAGGKKQVVEVGIAPFKVVTQRYPSEDEARSAAQGEMRRVSREVLQIDVVCPGNPSLAAEGLLLLDESWPGFMQGRWSIKTVTASGKRTGGYRSTIQASGLSV